jgi:hypothetical protein
MKPTSTRRKTQDLIANATPAAVEQQAAEAIAKAQQDPDFMKDRNDAGKLLESIGAGLRAADIETSPENLPKFAGIDRAQRMEIPRDIMVVGTRYFVTPRPGRTPLYTDAKTHTVYTGLQLVETLPKQVRYSAMNQLWTTQPWHVPITRPEGALIDSIAYDLYRQLLIVEAKQDQATDFIERCNAEGAARLIKLSLDNVRSVAEYLAGKWNGGNQSVSTNSGA